jgi:8-oxo-dGTP pyrophosphatase MutT (NUDIX family)
MQAYNQLQPPFFSKDTSKYPITEPSQDVPSKQAQKLSHPTLAPDIALIRAFFKARQGRPAPELRNPHIEDPVPRHVRSAAKDSAILLPIINHASGPTILVTRRHPRIRFAGHICFPGGRTDATDISPTDTALRETREEINLASEHIEVIGSLGDYYTQAGYKISPVVGIIEPPFSVEANPDEVSQIHEISLARVLNAANYALTWHRPDRAHFSFTEGEVRIAGPTVSLLIGFYEALLNIHD